jgi:hypothetical protein
MNTEDNNQSINEEWLNTPQNEEWFKTPEPSEPSVDEYGSYHIEDEEVTQEPLILENSVIESPNIEDLNSELADLELQQSNTRSSEEDLTNQIDSITPEESSTVDNINDFIRKIEEKNKFTMSGPFSKLGFSSVFDQNETKLGGFGKLKLKFSDEGAANPEFHKLAALTARSKGWSTVQVTPPNNPETAQDFVMSSLKALHETADYELKDILLPKKFEHLKEVYQRSLDNNATFESAPSDLSDEIRNLQENNQNPEQPENNLPNVTNDSLEVENSESRPVSNNRNSPNRSSTRP